MTDTMFAEVLAAAEAAGIDAVGSAELCAWASSALGLWREPGVATDPAADDLAFVDWLALRRGPVTDRLLAAVGAIGSAAAAERAGPLVDPVPDPAVVAAWSVATAGATVVAFELAHPDGTEVLLVDVGADGRLADIQFAADADVPAILGAGATEVDPTRLAPADAAAEVAAAWCASLDDPVVPGDAQLANLALLRARLDQLGHPVDEPVWVASVPLPTADVDADEAAAGVLRSALRAVLEQAAPDGAEAMVAPAARLVRWDSSEARPVSELEALASLEWADWLGAVIGLCRAGAGAAVGGQELVDHVNRVPEVTSTIPARDRDWFAWAFAVVAESWAEIGVVDSSRRLTVAGRWALPRALLAAWDRHDA